MNIFTEALQKNSQVLTDRQKTFFGKLVSYDNRVLNVILKIASYVFKSLKEEIEFQIYLREEMRVNQICSEDFDKHHHAWIRLMGLYKITQIKVISIGDLHIDFISREMLGEENIVRGVDCKRRPFIAYTSQDKVFTIHAQSSEKSLWYDNERFVVFSLPD